MKNFIVALCFLFLSITNGSSQFELGVKFGMHSIDLVSDGISLSEIDRTERINFEDANYGFHFGLYTRLKLFGLYLEPGFIFNSSSVDYSIDQLGEDGVFSSIKNETYKKFDIPVMLGFKVAFLRVYGGPVAHLHLDSTSDLIDIQGYSARFKEATYGWQAGVGFSLFKVNVDLQYEGNLSKFGEHITIDGSSFSFDESASRILLSLGFKLF